MRLVVVHGFLLLALLGGCASPSTRPAVAQAPPIPEPYVRLRETTNLVELQIAARRFVPRGLKVGPTIWLAGVSHVGDGDYYHRIQNFLDEQSLVLFEGISERNRGKVGTPPDPAPASGIASPRSSLQSEMANSLGLVFQLESVDYSRAHFRNSDLSVQELRDVLASLPSNGEGASRGFETLLSAMEGDSLLGTVVRFGLRFMGASPKLRAMGRLALLEMLGRLKGDIASMPGMTPDLAQLLQVLIEKRDERVVLDLRKELDSARTDDSITVFYGTGHMPDMEKRLRQELKYRPANEVWFTAFSVDLGPTGLSPSEQALVRNLVKKTLEELSKPGE